MTTISVPPHAGSVIEMLEKHGYEAVAVGGCVRDSLLGTVPNDWDVAAGCPPEVTMDIFKNLPGFSVYPTGLRHGTVTVSVDGEPVEVTTYRIDGTYQNHRAPEKVRFTDSLTDDLARRDFTVNAMAYSKRLGLVDPFGGREDLAAGIVRCVGDPEKRFSEDALRILRGIRFCAKLGFRMDPLTAEYANRLAGTLSHVSKERITAEISKFLTAPHAPAVMVKSVPILGAVFPDIDRKAIPAAAEIIEKIPKKELPVMLSAFILMCCEGAPDGVFNSLRLDKKTITSARHTLSALRNFSPDKPGLKRLCRDFGMDCVRDAALIFAALGNDTAHVWQYLDEIGKGECFSAKGLKIDGTELAGMGFRGRDIGDATKKLLDAVIDGHLENTPAALKSAAVKLADERGIRNERKI